MPRGIADHRAVGHGEVDGALAKDATTPGAAVVTTHRAVHQRQRIGAGDAAAVVAAAEGRITTDRAVDQRHHAVAKDAAAIGTGAICVGGVVADRAVHQRQGALIDDAAAGPGAGVVPHRCIHERQDALVENAAREVIASVRDS